MNKTIDDLVDEFQCPGCVCGSGIDCGEYSFDPDYMQCIAHVLGTQIDLGNHIALGLPKGFNKPGYSGTVTKPKNRNTMSIRLWVVDTAPDWDHLNIPVWALEQEGTLFVRTYLPRMNIGYVDVVDQGTLDLVPEATNVAKFIDEID